MGPLLFILMRAEEKVSFWLPVQQGSELLGYVGSEFGGGLERVTILFMLIHRMPTTQRERPHFLPVQKPPP